MLPPDPGPQGETTADMDSNPEPLIENDQRTGVVLSGVSVGYRDGSQTVVAAHDISFEVSEGQFVALIGPSGCGKSSVLNAIAGLLEPLVGVITVGENTEISTSNRLGKVAYMQQRDLLLPWRNVLANARLGLELAGVSRVQADQLATERASQFGLGSVLNSYPWQLSGGMKQRVALLRATLPESGTLLLDEPFGALDAITRRQLQQWLDDVLDRSRRAVLLVTHDIEEALLLADRVLVMSPGPGQIIDQVEVDLPRPRPDSIVTSREFIALKSRLMQSLAGASQAVGV